MRYTWLLSTAPTRSKLLDGKFGKHDADLVDALSSLPDHNQVLSAVGEMCKEQTDDRSRKHADLFQAFDNHGRDIASIVLGLQDDLTAWRNPTATFYAPTTTRRRMRCIAAWTYS